MKWSLVWSVIPAVLVTALPPATLNNAGKSLEGRDVPLWAAIFAGARDSKEAGFGRVQIQYWGANNEQGPLNNNGPPIPVTTHPKLGAALKIHLANRTDAQHPSLERWEALPPQQALYFNEGSDVYFRFDFVLDYDYPLNFKKFNVINQIHQADDQCCSPPVEFDIMNGNLVVHGENAALGDSATYDLPLGAVRANEKYKVVYHVKFSSTPAKSLLEVWVNNRHVLPPFSPKTATIRGGLSYWKGASSYAHWSHPAMTVYRNAHRVGTTLASVN
ncbi:MAG: hypothetical protein Q9221_001758 [Calogaya cf. arnoldii]